MSEISLLQKKKGHIKSEYRELKIDMTASELKEKNKKRKKKSFIKHITKATLKVL